MVVNHLCYFYFPARSLSSSLTRLVSSCVAIPKLRSAQHYQLISFRQCPRKQAILIISCKTIAAMICSVGTSREPRGRGCSYLCDVKWVLLRPYSKFTTRLIQLRRRELNRNCPSMICGGSLTVKRTRPREWRFRTSKGSSAVQMDTSFQRAGPAIRSNLLSAAAITTSSVTERGPFGGVSPIADPWSNTATSPTLHDWVSRYRE